MIKITPGGYRSGVVSYLSEPPVAPSPASLLTNLVAYYALSDESDSHTNTYTLTGNGFETYAAAKNSNGLDTSSGGNLAEGGSTAFDFNNKSFTFSFWVKCNDVTTAQTFLSWDGFGGVTCRCYNGFGIGFYLYDGSSWNTHEFVGAGMVNSTWHHVVARFNASTNEMALFFDGVKEVITAGGVAAVGGSPTLHVGTEGWGLQSSAIIDEAGIWYRAISDSEAADIYASGAGKFYSAF
jgi:hypothetical protein